MEASKRQLHLSLAQEPLWRCFGGADLRCVPHLATILQKGSEPETGNDRLQILNSYVLICSLQMK